MIARWRFILLAVLVFSAAVLIQLREGVATPQVRPFSEFPASHAGWRSLGDQTFDADVLRLLRPTAYLSRTYVHPVQGAVNLYIGFHDGGPESGPIHSPRNCLPGSGWEEYSRTNLNIEAGGRRVEGVYALFGKEKEKVLLLYWFQTQGENYRSEYAFKAASVVNALMRNRSDQAFVRISVSENADSSEARERAGIFARDFLPVIEGFLPH